MCVIYFVESESLDMEENNLELWSSAEEEGLLDDLSESCMAPTTDFTSSSETVESLSLARWIILFLMFIQATHKLSNTVISVLLKFFHTFLALLGQSSTLAMDISRNLPSSLYTASRLENRPNFRRYVVCRRCHKIYYIKECCDSCTQTVKTCSFIAYPSHPHRSMQRSCGTALLKTVELANGKTYFYPFLTYCYIGLDQSLQQILDRPDMYSLCEVWRARNQKEGVLQDVYDGRVWNEFQCFDGNPFLSESGNLALMMNMDFFQPYKHVQYSMGAIYLTILNLPCGVRNKQENTILVGLIPGPHEPRRDINTFLDPFVSDLQKFWSGVHLNVSSLKCRKLIRCALICVACDIPAGRKVCGFLSHSARLGCSRCYKRFSGTVGAMNYSGFDREKWPPRSGPKHANDAKSLLNMRTKTDLMKAESELGCRYSALLKLPYFDAPRMLIIDPMHNLFLGSAKYFLKSILLDQKILNETDFSMLQERVDRIIVPSDIGRIPHKILSGFASFTADQWKNWVIYYSLISMYNMLSSDIFECWRHFVLACRILCSRQLNMDQIMLADALLLRFCQRTERIFGWKCITPNMHLHCHLRSCIIDYGPLHGFWCYAFERYNGVLGSMPNNNRSIEIQLAGRFLKESQSLSTQFPSEFSEHFKPLFIERNSQGSVADMLFNYHESFSQNCWTIDSSFELPVHCYRETFTTSQNSYLNQLYCKMYPATDCSQDIFMSSIYYRYAHIVVNCKQLGSKNSRSAASSTVMALWNVAWFGPCSDLSSSDVVIRAARVNYFCKHSITVKGVNKTHVLVNLSWFLYHPKNTQLGKPITIWCHDLFEPCGIHTFVPIQLVKCRCVSLVDVIDNEDVFYSRSMY